MVMGIGPTRVKAVLFILGVEIQLSSQHNSISPI